MHKKKKKRLRVPSSVVRVAIKLAFRKSLVQFSAGSLWIFSHPMWDVIKQFPANSWSCQQLHTFLVHTFRLNPCQWAIQSSNVDNCIIYCSVHNSKSSPKASPSRFCTFLWHCLICKIWNQVECITSTKNSNMYFAWCVDINHCCCSTWPGILFLVQFNNFAWTTTSIGVTCS